MPGAMTTPVPPSTNTVADTVRDVAGYPPLQGAAVVAAGILLLCWLFIRWYDKRQVRRG
jgi:hypothetical protein